MTRQQTYVSHRASSTDPTGANADSRLLLPGATLTLLDVDGPGTISHIWFTMAGQAYHLKRMVLRIYWDGEESPSVEAPVGDFFGLGLGYYYTWQSEMLSVGSDKSLNCFFPMPYRRHARVTVTNEALPAVAPLVSPLSVSPGPEIQRQSGNVSAVGVPAPGNIAVPPQSVRLYYNIDYRTDSGPLPKDTLYFHSQYRQAQPNHGWTNKWTTNRDPLVNNKTNLDGHNNYVWIDAKGHGQYVGVTMSVLQNQDGWWGEGDDMFLIDGDSLASIVGTGAEDYFLGAWNFGGMPFSYQLYGAPVIGQELAGSRSSVYRFHFDSPIPFRKSFKATVEHGNANHRSDNYYSVAYWYQAEPHDPFPRLPSVEERLPTLQWVGGPGNADTAPQTDMPPPH